ncbi:hypothetical protein CMK19_14210 [Candidatus Poribacteria bacterium]|nr:hypothetical protein [Candidatus Poribacteria bacterium]MEE2911554.1 Crp/Fnr family transcriptional regulator [Candidatus Poribacteria bacterium]|tara:strand:+ start:636 stop:1478 length:843 start_codon:yes stop_codon:yes gene_type:complete
MNQKNQERFWTVKGINLFQHLPAKAIRERTLKTVELDRYQPIHHADELGEIVYLVEVGRVKLQSPAEGSIFDDESSEEQEHTIKTELETKVVIESGDVLGERPISTESRGSITAESIDPVRLLIIPLWEFNLLLKKYPTLNLWVRKLLFRKIYYPLDFVIERSVSSRLAFFLIKQAAMNGKIENGILHGKLEFFRTQIARLLGTNVGLIDQYLSELDHRKIIKLRWRKFSILDQWKLKKVADNRREELVITKVEEPDDLSLLMNPQPLPNTTNDAIRRDD